MIAAELVVLPTNTLILLGIGAIIPPFTSFLTKWHAPDYVKKFVTTVLAVAGAAVAEGINAIQTGQDWTFYGLAYSAIVAWLAANFAYSKFWQDNPITDKIVKATAGFGLSHTPSPWPFPEPKPTDVGQPEVQADETTVAVGEVPVEVDHPPFEADPLLAPPLTRPESGPSAPETGA